MARRKDTCIPALLNLEINWDDAHALRRISMTLHSWFELECGDGNSHGSWAIVRGRKELISPNAPLRFIHDDDGKPYMEHHHYQHGNGKDYTTYRLLPDLERDAEKRLAKLMSKYPTLVPYIQTDPRGASIYILRRDDVPQGASIDSCYNRGVAVYR